MERLQLDVRTIAVVKEYAGDAATAAKADAALAAIDAFNPANLSDAGTLLPNDQLVIWRDGVMLRTTVAALPTLSAYP